ncbi:hypothetical protein [Actinomadura algeriensis]|uniref:Uncharacterized protein n=1 Tax=Actinomadura algeriensis TaxID=1679523 RepID=A0ABR9K0P7_9ACTN|nr:hypothetical protein [Actinomadura algeriensis]MBE1536409.1 hypothetical protein [Actinomadura algeriensis]
MTTVTRGFLRGVAAGAAGTTALNATTQADMAVRARPASRVPDAVMSELADRTGTTVAGGDGERGDRLEGAGALGGTLTGLAVGGLAGALRATGVRLPAAIGGPLLGAAAMAAADLPAARLAITDPRHWTPADWASDAIPHLAYGVAAHATLAATFRADEHDRRPGAPEPARRPSLARAAALGAATGCRSTAGLTAVALRARRTDTGPARLLARPGVRALHVLMAAGESGWDKHPSVPDRDAAQGMIPRVLLAAAAAAATARRDRTEYGPPALVAAASAAGTAAAAIRLRGAAARRFGSDLPGALTEDAAAALLAWLGTRRR